MTRSRMRLVLELDRPDSSVLDDAGFPTQQRFRTTIVMRIPWVERTESESEDAMWERIEWEFRKSLAFEILGSGKDIIGALTRTLCAKLRAGTASARFSSPFGTYFEQTEPAPPSSAADDSSVPPPTPTLPSGVALPIPAPDSDHVDAPPESR